MMRLVPLLVAAAILVSGCSEPTPTTPRPGTTPTPAPGTQQSARAVLEAKSESGVSGWVTFTAAGNGSVHYQARIEGATPGAHAFHIHEHGDCSAPDGSSAGGHWNPHSQSHGAPGADSHHAGDLGNIEVGDDGVGEAEGTSSDFNLTLGDDLCAIGKGVIVHAAADDFVSQPSGAAGSRIACGVIAPE